MGQRFEYGTGAAKQAAPDPRQAEVTLTWPGGKLIVRGRLAWFLKKLAERGDLAEDMERLNKGSMEARWGDNGQLEAHTRRTYHWPA